MAVVADTRVVPVVVERRFWPLARSPGRRTRTGRGSRRTPDRLPVEVTTFLLLALARRDVDVAHVSEATLLPGSIDLLPRADVVRRSDRLRPCGRASSSWRPCGSRSRGYFFVAFHLRRHVEAVLAVVVDQIGAADNRRTGDDGGVERVLVRIVEVEAGRRAARGRRPWLLRRASRGRARDACRRLRKRGRMERPTSSARARGRHRSSRAGQTEHGGDRCSQDPDPSVHKTPLRSVRARSPRTAAPTRSDAPEEASVTRLDEGAPAQLEGPEKARARTSDVPEPARDESTGRKHRPRARPGHSTMQRLPVTPTKPEQLRTPCLRPRGPVPQEHRRDHGRR